MSLSSLTPFSERWKKWGTKKFPPVPWPVPLDKSGPNKFMAGGGVYGTGVGSCEGAGRGGGIVGGRVRFVRYAFFTIK